MLLLDSLFTVMKIRELVQQDLRISYLTLAAKNQRRLLLFKSKYDLENLNAFSELQTAVINARVLPEARELINLRSIKQNVCSSLLTTKIRRHNSTKD